MCYDSTTENCVRQSPACSPCPFWACYNLDNIQPCFHCCGNGCRKERCRKKKALGTSGKWRHHDLLNRELELEAMPKDMEIDYLKYLLFSIFKRMHVQGKKKKSNCKKKKKYKTRGRSSILQYSTPTPESHCQRTTVSHCASFQKHPLQSTEMPQISACFPFQQALQLYFFSYCIKHLYISVNINISV